ncbi:MAG: TolC family protein [Oligoflexia bacterium]|nr:TolC family protein [Oligoflexia bacterium]MBF0365581.1 TolC family protein [Oligoflexia bacterium]
MQKIFSANLLLFCSFSFSSSAIAITIESKVIDLEQGLQAATAYSQKIESQEQSYQSALARGRSLRADYFPQFSLDGQYRWVDHIPSVTLPAPLNKTVEMGNHSNYSAGINLHYLVTDFGQTSKGIDSAKAEAEAERENKRLSADELTLSLKKVYYKLIFQTSQLRSLLDAWELAHDQERDMERRFRSGSSSLLDYTTATKDTLSFKLKFLQTQTEFSFTLQDWLALTGETLAVEKLRSPLPQELSTRPKKLPSRPSLAVTFSSPTLAASTTSMRLTDFQHPSLLQLEQLKLAQKLKAESMERSYFPRLSLGARTSLEYPDGGKKESYHQNSIFLTVSMPLWDGGKRSNLLESTYALERSFAAKKENLTRELQDTSRKMQQLLLQLQEQAQVAKEGTKDAKRLATLTYQSYLNGKTNYLQVQSANLKVLEWKTQEDSLLYARSMALAQLEFLGEHR